jgi:hypothetical protein
MGNWNPADYETVDSRIKRFYGDNPTGRVNTELVAAEGPVGATRWIVKASVWRSGVALGQDDPDGTGYAFEVDGSGGMANKTSALENCETSAIGRALANIGYSGDKRASREEMAKATQAATPARNWQAKVAGANDLAALSEIHAAAVAEGWATPELMQALTQRKAEIGKAKS